MVEAARLRMKGLGRHYRHLRLESMLGRKPTVEELAANALELDALLVKANELDPAGANDTWQDAYDIVERWNLSRRPGEPPV
jgi:hypothetical protein